MTTEQPRITQPWALKNLPPFRPVAAKLLRLAAQEDVPLNKVQQVLRTDVAFSAEVLRLANSALIGSRTGVSSVEHAVGLLGLERLKALSMTIAMRDFATTRKSNITMQACWKYNLATAVICEWLAPRLALQPDACYTAGLLHDIGRLAILRAFPEEYERMLSVIQDYGFDLLRCEQDLFDIDHCAAGRWLLERWDFPNELQSLADRRHAGLLAFRYPLSRDDRGDHGHAAGEGAPEYLRRTRSIGRNGYRKARRRRSRSRLTLVLLRGIAYHRSQDASG